jgi:hypothetical protein
MTLQMPKMDSTGQTREFEAISATRATYWSSIAQYTRVGVKLDILKKF